MYGRMRTRRHTAQRNSADTRRLQTHGVCRHAPLEFAKISTTSDLCAAVECAIGCVTVVYVCVMSQSLESADVL